ncbi:STAS domain-containing protein [Streptomyces sp. NPDC052301]|uniref:STAS domain-containing protein n=1 Tax=Streptomyces sp. NPDC052301 TaxID=3365687 RepID=UPI0037CD9DD9
MHDPARRAQSLTAPDPERTGDEAAARPVPPGRASMSYGADGHRVSVTVRGELDLDSGRQLRPDLHEALAGSAGDVDLDLSGLDFCDCAGLSVLQDLRQRAVALGRTVVVRSSSPAFDRLLLLVGAQELFTSGPEHQIPANRDRPDH